MSQDDGGDDALTPLYDGIMPFFLALPSIDHLAALILCVLLPGFFWALCITLNWVIVDRHSADKSSYLASSAGFVVRRAGVISLVNFVVLSLFMANQTTRFIMNTTIGTDIMYYTKVDLPEYDSYDAVSAAASTSFNSVAASLQSLNPLAQRGFGPDFHGRRLGSTTPFTLIYHSSNYDEILSNTDLLTDICNTERNIRSQSPCLGLSTFATVLSAFFDVKTCELVVPDPVAAARSLSSDETAAYFEDGFNANDPQTHVIISVTTSGTCHGSENSVEMADVLHSYQVGSAKVSYAETSYLQDDFVLAVIYCAFLTIAGLALSVVFFTYWIRGLICGFTTVYIICGSIVLAAGTLETWQYGSFSAFNVMAVYILIGIGCNAVLLFDSAWRGVVAPGHRVDSLQLITIYRHIAEPTLFTVLAACLSLFSKLASPVIVISQLGAFMGTGVVVLYAQLHYLLIPMWIVANRVVLPMCWHNCIDRCRLFLLEACMCVVDACGCRGLVDFCTLEDGESDRSGIAPPPTTRQTSLDMIDDLKIERQGLLGTTSASAATANITTNRWEDADAQTECSGVSSPDGGIAPASNAVSVSHFNQRNQQLSVDSNSNRAGTETASRPGEVVQPHEIVYAEDRLTIGEDYGALHQQRLTDVDLDIATFTQQQPSDKRTNSKATAKPTTTTLGSVVARFMKSYYFVVWCRLLMLLCTLLSLVVVSYLVSVHFELDFGIPQLFTPNTNLGQCFVVLRNYKTSILDSSITSLPPTPPQPNLPTATPTTRPTARPTLFSRPTLSPTATPTLFPTQTPTAPTAAPTPSPSVVSNTPTFLPTRTPAPTRIPTNNSPSASHKPTNSPVAVPSDNPAYTISGCYGIYYSKEYKDTEVVPSYDAEIFTNYSTSNGFLRDMYNLCQYVDTNRNRLDIDPDWVMTRDCLYYQLVDTANERRKLLGLPLLDDPDGFDANATVSKYDLLEWAYSSTVNGALLGIEAELDTVSYTQHSGRYHHRFQSHNYHHNADFRATIKQEIEAYSNLLRYDQQLASNRYKFPVIRMQTGTLDTDEFSAVKLLWICTNFSVVSPVPSLIADTAAAKSMLRSWQQVFKGDATTNADAAGVPVHLSSEAFTLPLLASEVLTSIEIAGIVSLAGFVALLYLFTFNVGLTLAGTLIMTVILCVTFTLHLYFVTPVVDLLDIVVLIAIIGMIVDFPIHMLKYFTMVQKHKNRTPASAAADAAKLQLLASSTLSESETLSPSQIVDNGSYTLLASTELTMEDGNAGAPLTMNNPHLDNLITSLEDTNIFTEVRNSFTLASNGPPAPGDSPQSPTDPTNKSVVVVLHTAPSHTMFYSLLGPCITNVLVALPLLLATIELLRKTGEYIVTMAVVSYFMTCVVTPYLLELTAPGGCCRPGTINKGVWHRLYASVYRCICRRGNETDGSSFSTVDSKAGVGVGANDSVFTFGAPNNCINAEAPVRSPSAALDPDAQVEAHLVAPLLPSAPELAPSAVIADDNLTLQDA